MRRSALPSATFISRVVMKNTSVTKFGTFFLSVSGVSAIHCMPSVSLARIRVNDEVSQRFCRRRYVASMRSILLHVGSANGSAKRSSTSSTFTMKASVATSRARTCIAPRFAFNWQISPQYASTRSRGSAPARTSALKMRKFDACTARRDMRKELMLFSSSSGERERAWLKESLAIDGNASAKHESRSKGPRIDSRSMLGALVVGAKKEKNGIAAARVLCSTAATTAI